MNTYIAELDGLEAEDQKKQQERKEAKALWKELDDLETRGRGETVRAQRYAVCEKLVEWAETHACSFIEYQGTEYQEVGPGLKRFVAKIVKGAIRTFDWAQGEEGKSRIYVKPSPVKQRRSVQASISKRTAQIYGLDRERWIAQ